MKVSAQEEYGLRCLMQMARQGAKESLSILEISREEGLSVPNVAKLMRILRLGGLVHSVRGKAGGYALARPAESITLDEVLQVLGGPLFGPQFCELHPGIERACTHHGDCAMRPVWLKLQFLLGKVMARTSLQDLMRNEKQMREWVESNFGDSRIAERDTLAGAATT
jgi:Rrf2 family transcriptional regulator, iron-sulfur cluster assembly transcription factor